MKKAASEGGALLPLFVAPSQLKPFISKELKDGPLRPIDYQDGDRIVRGFDASVLVVVCNIWLSARQAGVLQTQQLPKAQKAELLTRALAETGIVALVDEATGYEKVRPQNALQRYLEILVRKELAAWAKKFPDEFYENIYRLKGWPWPGMGKNRYSVVAYYTRDLVYERLGPGLLKELEGKSPKNGDGYRPSRLHQWLTDDVGCQSARKRNPGPAFKKDPRGRSFCSVRRRHPSVPAHASDEPSRGAAVKNGRFSGGRP